MSAIQQIQPMLETVQHLAQLGDELAQLEHNFNKHVVSGMNELTKISRRLAEFLAEVMSEDAKIYAASIVLDFKNLLNVVRRNIDVLLGSPEFTASKPHLEKLKQMNALHGDIQKWYNRVAEEYRAGYNDSAD